MPRYFFHLHNDVHAPDHEGVELKDLEAARQIARHSAQFSAAESIKEKGHLVLDHRIDTEDANGTVLDTVHFRDVVTVEG